MFARIINLKVQPERIDEATRIYQNSIVPAAKLQHGFREAILITDKQSGEAYSLTLWETEADLKAGEASSYLKDQLSKYIHLVTTPLQPKNFAVAVHVREEAHVH